MMEGEWFSKCTHGTELWVKWMCALGCVELRRSLSGQIGLCNATNNHPLQHWQLPRDSPQTKKVSSWMSQFYYIFQLSLEESKLNLGFLTCCVAHGYMCVMIAYSSKSVVQKLLQLVTCFLVHAGYVCVVMVVGVRQVCLMVVGSPGPGEKAVGDSGAVRPDWPDWS